MSLNDLLIDSLSILNQSMTKNSKAIEKIHSTYRRTPQRDEIVESIKDCNSRIKFVRDELQRITGYQKRSDD